MSDPQPGAVRRAFDYCFRSRETGRITIAQLPNVALWIFLATVVVRWFIGPGDSGRTAIDAVAAASLGWWAVDEVLRGVNPWRRVLGVGGAVAALAGAVALVR